MAKIIWRTRPTQLLEGYIENASMKFGKSTALRWAEEVAAFEDRVRLYPTSYTQEALLVGRKKLYRRCNVMNRRFKIIYFYDEKDDVVTVMDIWDTKRNPKALVRKIR